MCKIKALLFDMDGVLIDAKEWHYEALNRALKLFGLSISRFDHLHTFDGLPTRVKLQMLSEQYYLPLELHTFINLLKQKYTMELINVKCKPTFHHEYALGVFHREGYKIAVCSNSIRSTIQSMMQKSSLDGYLDIIVSNEDVANGKPSPEIYQKAMALLGVMPSECLVIEDNPKGIAAGKASGAHVMAVNTIYDVNYENICREIRKYEEFKC